MRIAFLLFLLVVLVGGYFGYQHYVTLGEAIVDQAVDREIETADLASLAEHKNDGLTLLKSGYTSPGWNDVQVMRFRILRGNWHQHAPSIAHRAWLSKTPIDDARLDPEIDQRFGAGAFAALMDQEVQYARDKPVRDAARAAAQARAQADMRYVMQYMMAHNGQTPPTRADGSIIIPGR